MASWVLTLEKTFAAVGLFLATLALVYLVGDVVDAHVFHWHSWLESLASGNESWIKHAHPRLRQALVRGGGPVLISAVLQFLVWRSGLTAWLATVVGDSVRRRKLPPFLSLPTLTSGPLDYTSRTVPLIGRSAELRELDLFAEGDGFKWWWVQGPGGFGKKKLAFHWIRTLRGWHGGFIVGTEIDTSWTPKRPTLMVLPDAAERPDKTLRLIEQLSSRTWKKPIRLLLLDRYRGDELRQLEGGRLSKHRFRTKPLELAVFDQTQLDALADDLGAGKNQVVSISTTGGVPLLAVMQLSGELASARSRDEILDQHVERFCYKAREFGLGDTGLRLLALATLVGGLKWSDVSPDERTELEPRKKALEKLTGVESSRRVPPIQPDVLGSRFVVMVLEELTMDRRLSLLRDAWVRAPEQAARSILRIETDDPDRFRAILDTASPLLILSGDEDACATALLPWAMSRVLRLSELAGGADPESNRPAIASCLDEIEAAVQAGDAKDMTKPKILAPALAVMFEVDTGNPISALEHWGRLLTTWKDADRPVELAPAVAFAAGHLSDEGDEYASQCWPVIEALPVDPEGGEVVDLAYVHGARLLLLREEDSVGEPRWELLRDEVLRRFRARPTSGMREAYGRFLVVGLLRDQPSQSSRTVWDELQRVVDGWRSDAGLGDVAAQGARAALLRVQPSPDERSQIWNTLAEIATMYPKAAGVVETVMSAAVVVLGHARKEDPDLAGRVWASCQQHAHRHSGNDEIQASLTDAAGTYILGGAKTLGRRKRAPALREWLRRVVVLTDITSAWATARSAANAFPSSLEVQRSAAEATSSFLLALMGAPPTLFVIDRAWRQLQIASEQFPSDVEIQTAVAEGAATAIVLYGDLHRTSKIGDVWTRLRDIAARFPDVPDIRIAVSEGASDAIFYLAEQHKAELIPELLKSVEDVARENPSDGDLQHPLADAANDILETGDAGLIEEFGDRCRANLADAASRLEASEVPEPDGNGQE